MNLVRFSTVKVNSVDVGKIKFSSLKKCLDNECYNLTVYENVFISDIDITSYMSDNTILPYRLL